MPPAESLILPDTLPESLHAWQPSASTPWDHCRAAHLYRRAGLGASLPELDAAVAAGFEPTVQRLLNPPATSGPLDDLLHIVRTELVKFDDDLIEPQSFWFYRMLSTDRPLEEKMALFWHNHFATANYKVNNPGLMYSQYETLRTHGLGRFEDMLLAVARDPAMIIWLDNGTNRKGQPNENFAREVLELFTLGPGHYSEDDIREAARAFTGWHLKGYQYTFNQGQHDAGEKTFMGQTGAFGGEDIVRMLAANPDTGRFLAAKMLRYFVMEQPPADAVEGLAQVYLANGSSIAAMMQVLLRSQLFYAPEAYRSLVASPVEVVVSTIRLLDANSNRDMSFPAMVKMGQELFNPPNVKGWEGGDKWLNSVTLLERMNFLNDLLLRSPVKVEGRDHLLLQRLKETGARQPAEVVGFLTRYVVQDDVTAEQRAMLEAYYAAELAKTEANPAGESWDFKLRRVAYMIMSLPAYQLT